jgi:AcrR family transcriptional regulator
VAERGDFAFGVREVVKRAQVSLRTFYHYFEAKDDFVLALFTEWNERFAHQIMSTMPDGPGSVRFEHFVFTMVIPSRWGPHHIERRALAAESEGFRLRRARPDGFAQAIQPIREILKQIIIDTRPLGSSSGDIDRDVAVVHNSILTEVYSISIRHPIAYQEMAEHLFKYHRRGLGI